MQLFLSCGSILKGRRERKQTDIGISPNGILFTISIIPEARTITIFHEAAREFQIRTVPVLPLGLSPNALTERREVFLLHRSCLFSGLTQQVVFINLFHDNAF